MSAEKSVNPKEKLEGEFPVRERRIAAIDSFRQRY